MNRNEFINKAARVTLLSAMTILIGIFAFQGKLSGTSTCTENKYCRKCSRLTDCNLPNALKERSKDGKG